MCVLQKRLELRASTNDISQLTLSPPISNLLQACVDSAVAILKILRALEEHNLLGTKAVCRLHNSTNILPESFLPFHLEDGFCSAFVLYIIQATLPDHIHDVSWYSSIYIVLEAMIGKGSATAQLRRDELNHLGLLLAPFLQHESNPVSTPIGAGSEHQLSRGSNMTDYQVADTDWESLDPFSLSGGIGITRGEILNLAEQLDIDNLSIPFFLDT